MKKIKPRFKSLLLLTIAMAVLLLTGCPSAPAVNDKFTVDMFTSPVKPEGISATRGKSEISISWKKDPTVSYYDLYKARNYNGSFTKYATFYPVDYSGDEIVFVDDADSAGSVSLYYVEAVKNVTIGVGQNKVLMSEPSDIAVGSTVPKVIAQSPRKTKELKLTWMDYGLESMDGPLFPEHYYQVIRNDEVVLNTKEMEIDQCSWVDTTALPDTKYYYTVELYYDNGDGTYSSVTSNTIEFDTSVNYVPNAIKAESVVITDKNHVDNPEGKLAFNDIMLKWSYDVPNVLISKNEELIPQFKIERSVAGLNDWKIVAYYDAIESVSTEDITDKNVRRFNYEYHDTSCLAGTSYEYRFTVRYHYGTDGITEQDEEPVVLPTIAKTLAYPTKFYLSDYPTDEELRTHKFEIALNWEVPAGYEKEGLFYVIERTELDNGATTDATTWTPVGEPVPVDLSKNGIYQIYDKFECTLEEMSSYRDFSYRISVSDSSLVSDELVMDDYFHIKNIYEKFEIVKANTFNASVDRADGVLVSWNVEKNHVLETLGNVDVAIEDLYFILSCNGVVLKEGPATDAEFVNNPMDKEYVFSYLHEGVSTGNKYSLEAIYKQGVPEDEFSFKTSIISGKTLLDIEGVEADRSAAAIIHVVFFGDPAAASFQIHYRYEGDSIWLTDDTLVITNDAVPEASENAIFETVKYIFEFGLLNDDSENLGRNIEFAITMTDRQGFKNEPSDSMAIGSYFGVYGMNVTASQAIENGVATADRINLAWSAVEGAESYLVYRSDNEYNGFGIVEDFQFNADGLSGSDKFVESDNMSGTFYYKVVPFKDGIEPQIDIVPAYKGTFFAPPKNIVATKAERIGSINITWDKVQDASGYTIYRKLMNTEDPWTEIGFLGNTDHYLDSNIRIDADYAYTVNARYANSAESFVQNSFVDNSNVGYAFFNVPDNVSLSQNSEGKYVVSWATVKGASNYKIHLYDVEQGGVFVPKFIDVKDDGSNKIAYVIDDPNVKYITSEKYAFAPMSIIAENEYIHYGDKGVVPVYPTYGIAAGKESIGANQIIMNLIDFLKPQLMNANVHFNGDWWTPDAGGLGALTSAQSVYGEGTSVCIRATRGGGSYTGVTYTGPDASGIVLTEAVDEKTGYKYSTRSDIYCEPGDGGSSGYRGKDPLHKIGLDGSGVIDIYDAAGNKTDVSIRIRDVVVNGLTRYGFYSIYFDDVEVYRFEDGSSFPNLYM